MERVRLFLMQFGVEPGRLVAEFPNSSGSVTGVDAANPEDARKVTITRYGPKFAQKLFADFAGDGRPPGVRSPDGGDVTAPRRV